jgi:hypothetical protein
MAEQLPPFPAVELLRPVSIKLSFLTLCSIKLEGLSNDVAFPFQEFHLFKKVR